MTAAKSRGTQIHNLSGGTDRVFEHHTDRLKTATLATYTLDRIPEWIQKHTHLGGAPFSFVDHEYQEKILRDQAQEVVIRKCSQVGISELSARLALALCNIKDYYTVIYTLPTAAFATTFMRTRVDPVINSSPLLKSAIHQTVDNADVKQFSNSFMYIKGSQSTNAPISIPADHLFHDELDFSDEDVVSQYHSRLSHSKYKRKTKLSTPTQPDYGIDYEFQNSKRHWNFVKCDHCGHFFVPNYYENVVIPGFSGDLHLITKKNLHSVRYLEAFVACPKCGKPPSLQKEHREWVCENPSENHVSSGYQVQPFDAPNIITIPDLVKASTSYVKQTDFQNYGLGLPAEDTEATLGTDDFNRMFVPKAPLGFPVHVMGIDMGLFCHFMIAGVSPDGSVIVVYTEVVPLAKFQERRQQLAGRFRVVMTVMDSLPYTETVLRLQERDPNLYGAVYVNNMKSLEPFHIRVQNEEKDEGLEGVRQVSVNRNKALDMLFLDVREGQFMIEEDENKQLIQEHMRDMKRVRKFTPENELHFVWSKSLRGNDHFHHTSLYTWIAARLKGTSVTRLMLPPIPGKFKLNNAGIAVPENMR